MKTLEQCTSRVLQSIQLESDTQESEFRCNKPLVYYSEPSFYGSGEYATSSLGHEDFSLEIDNYISLTGLKNAMFGPVIDGDGKVQGAIQIINKAEGREHFDEEDVREFKCICGVIGTIIRNANQTLDFIKLSAKMYKCIDKIKNLLFCPQIEAANKGHEFENSLYKIQKNVKKIINEKKSHLFQNVSYMNELFQYMHSKRNSNDDE